MYSFRSFATFVRVKNELQVHMILSLPSLFIVFIEDPRSCEPVQSIDRVGVAGLYLRRSRRQAKNFQGFQGCNLSCEAGEFPLFFLPLMSGALVLGGYDMM